MKMKRTILALSACSLAILPAQTVAPEKEAAVKTEKAEEVEAETPVEKQAFKMLDLLDTLSEIMGSIKDEASLAEAEVKLTELVTKVKAEEAALLKFEVPANASRRKISKQRAVKEKEMGDKMMPIMIGMQNLDPAVTTKFGSMMQKMKADLQGNEGKLDKYFKTDEELEKDKK